jgi:hypothetical protein
MSMLVTCSAASLNKGNHCRTVAVWADDRNCTPSSLALVVPVVYIVPTRGRDDPTPERAQSSYHDVRR